MQEERGITRRLEEGGQRKEGRKEERGRRQADVVYQGFLGKEVDGGGRRAEEEMERW